jgi:hypothetical protein
MYLNPYIWFWFGYGLVWQNNRPYTPLKEMAKKIEKN